MISMTMSIDEACEYLNISKTTMWRLRKGNKIPCFNVGRRVFFNKAILDKWMMEGGTRDEPVSDGAFS